RERHGRRRNRAAAVQADETRSAIARSGGGAGIPCGGQTARTARAYARHAAAFAARTLAPRRARQSRRNSASRLLEADRLPRLEVESRRRLRDQIEASVLGAVLELARDVAVR